MKKRDPLMDYVVALLVRGNNSVILTKEELQRARRKNFSVTIGKDFVQLAILRDTRSIMPFEQKKD
jgi:hypothetical protein